MVWDTTNNAFIIHLLYYITTPLYHYTAQSITRYDQRARHDLL